VPPTKWIACRSKPFGAIAATTLLYRQAIATFLLSKSKYFKPRHLHKTGRMVCVAPKPMQRFESTRTIRLVFLAALATRFLLSPEIGWGQITPGLMVDHWNEGAADCSQNPQPPLEVHPYNSRTFILRESLCATFEAPFMYLLVGSTRALLIDTGDVADPSRMPLAKTVMSLLPKAGSATFPLLVVHTHRHGDHRSGDTQFEASANVQVVRFDLNSVLEYYRFAHWPDGLAPIDLGDRIVDAMPTPGHNETEISFYDRETGLFFSGDFLMPGRLLIDNAGADLASADRVAAFVKDHPISYVLGGHIEMNSAGRLFSWQSQYHPQERALQMSKDDLAALPAALRDFNGFYTVRGNFTMENPIRVLIFEGVLVFAFVIGCGWILVRYRRRRGLARGTAKVNA